MPMPRRCSAPPSTAPTSPPRVLPTSPRHAGGQPPSCTGTTTSPGTAASAMSPRRSAMPARTAPSSPPAMPCTSRRASAIRAAGAGRPATGPRSAPSPSTPSATAPPPPAKPCSLVRLATLLSRPDLARPQPRRAAAVMEGAQPPAATRSRASMARLASTAPSPPRAPWQPHPPSVDGTTRHPSDRRPRYENSAATTLTRTVGEREQPAEPGPQPVALGLSERLVDLVEDPANGEEGITGLAPGVGHSTPSGQQQ